MAKTEREYVEPPRRVKQAVKQPVEGEDFRRQTSFGPLRVGGHAVHPARMHLRATPPCGVALQPTRMADDPRKTLLDAVRGKRPVPDSEWYHTAKQQVQSGVTRAILTLLAVMDDEEAPAGARVQAANSLLDRAGLAKVDAVMAAADEERELTADEHAEALELAKKLASNE